jgi:hypothetical protein
MNFSWFCSLLAVLVAGNLALSESKSEEDYYYLGNDVSEEFGAAIGYFGSMNLGLPLEAMADSSEKESLRKPEENPDIYLSVV